LLSLPKSLLTIGNGAFFGCTGLMEINFIQPTSLTVLNGGIGIGTGVFEGCTGLTRINLPEGITQIIATFMGCTNLIEVTLPDTLTRIGSNTFVGTNIRSIVLPASLTTINATVFSPSDNTNPNLILSTVTFKNVPAAASFQASAFYGNLQAVAIAGGVGTYTREGDVWTKQ